MMCFTHHYYPCYRRCYHHRLALHSDAKREVPEIPEVPEITEKTQSPNCWTIAAYAYCSSFLLSPLSIVSPPLLSRPTIVFLSYCFRPPFSPQLSIVPAHNREYRTTHAIVFFLLSRPLLSRIPIVFTYYTAFDRHSIYSSTVSLYDSPSRVSCLSWQSTRS